MYGCLSVGTLTLSTSESGQPIDNQEILGSALFYNPYTAASEAYIVTRKRWSFLIQI